MKQTGMLVVSLLGCKFWILGRFPFDQKFRDFRSETEWKGKNSGKSFRKFRNTFWVHPLWRNFRNYRKFCVPFARNVGFSLSTKRELTWALEETAAVAAYQCSACGFVANDISLFLQHKCRSLLPSTSNGINTAVVMFFFSNLIALR